MDKISKQNADDFRSIPDNCIRTSDAICTVANNLYEIDYMLKLIDNTSETPDMPLKNAPSAVAEPSDMISHMYQNLIRLNDIINITAEMRLQLERITRR